MPRFLLVLYFLVIEYIFTMSEIKLSPLLLFLTMLIVLVIATTVKRWGLVSEGFIGYLYSSGSFSSQTVKAYDNTASIFKLYDDIYYDQRNGNSVIVNASPYTSSSDDTGATVTSIDVVPRKYNNAVSYTKGSASTTALSQQCEESKQKTIDSLETQWSVKGLSSTNQLNYITWGNDTYLYIMDLTNTIVAGNTSVAGNSVSGNTTVSGSYKPAVSAYFNDTMKQSTNSYSNMDAINLTASYSYSSTGKDDTHIMDDFYDKTQTVFQLLTYVWFDVKNGNLLVQTGVGTGRKIDVYSRGSSNSTYSYTSATTGTTPASQLSFSQTSVKPYFIQDTLGNHTIMYWPNGDNTILITFKNVLETNGMIGAKNCRRFTRDGLYNANAPVTAVVDVAIDKNANKEILDAFSRWYIYFNTNAVGSGDSSDYLLKTQIVPPVCPACPGCQGVCTDCGGNGGSGTKSSNSSSLAFDNKTAVGATGNVVNSAVGATGDILNKTVDTAGNVVNKTVDTAGNVVGKTLDTAGNVVEKTLDTAGNLLSSTASRLGLDRVGYQQSYGGPANTSSSGNTSGYPSSGHNNTSYRPGSNTTGVSTLPNSNPNDPYSYNGALQSKGGNYMAMTTDFSRFGR